MIQCTGILSPFVTSHPVTENILARVKQRTVWHKLTSTSSCKIARENLDKHRASVDARTILDMELFLSCCYKVSR